MREKINLLIAATALSVTASPVQAGEANGGPFAVIQCPAKGKATARSHDLSTGVARWIVGGPNLPEIQRQIATPITESTLPKGWSARLPGARWVQAMAVSDLAMHASGDYFFAISFSVPKQKRMPRLTLDGAFIADDTFQLDLAEPAPPNSSIGHGVGRMNLDNQPGKAPQDEVQSFTITETGDGSGKPLGHRPGLYTIRIDVQNGMAPHAALGLIARIKLTANCAGGK